MKTSRIISTLFAVCIGGLVLARAAAPVVQSATGTSVQQGGSVTLQASVADADGDLAFVAFYAAVPGIAGWLHLGDRNVSGTSASATLTWQPPLADVYSFLVEAHDTTGSTSAQSTFEVFGGRLVVPSVTISNGVNRMYQNTGEVVTTENQSSSNVIVQNGGNLILWAGGRVTLKPGFHAQAGSFFWAAVDHNMNGYSDLEEVTDTDGDGMFDAWEVDHGLNPIVNDANSDLDGDGATNLSEFLAGRDPNNRADGATLPSTVQLILKTPSRGYLGVNTSSWKITSVANP
jgi:hypothetical protein